MRVALVVAGKELRQRLRDRSAIILAFIAPTLLAAIVTGAFGSGFGPSDFHAEVGVVDKDDSDISQAFVEDVLGSPQLRDQLTVHKISSTSKAREMVTTLELPAAFVIPDGFQADVARGGEAELLVLRHAAAPIIGEIADAIATGFTEQVNAARLSIFTTIRSGGASAADIPSLAEKAAAARIPVQLEDGDIAAREVSGANYFGPGMAIFFLFFTVGAGARSLLAEREQGTMPRILAAPSARHSILLGKALAMFVLALASMTTVYLVMGVVFGVNWGDPLAIAALTVAIVIAVMCVTALVQTLAKTEQQAANYGSIVGFFLGMLGGNFFPLFQLPDLVQKISALTPNGWALRGFTDIAYDGATVADLGPNLAAIAAFVVVCGSIAYIRARRIVLA